MLAGIAFGATYVYSDPMLQMRLGIKPLIDSLPWKHEELVAEARQHPLEFQQMSLMLSSREGTPVSEPKASFTDAEITNQKYLKWQATFKNDLEGLEGRTDEVEARFYDRERPSDCVERPEPVRRTLAKDSRLQRRRADAGPDLAAVGRVRGRALPRATSTSRRSNSASRRTSQTKPKPPPRASLPPSALDLAGRRGQESRGGREEDYAYIEEIRRKPLELMHIEFLNSTKTGTPLSGPGGKLRRIEGAVRGMASKLQESPLQAGQQSISRRCGIHRAGRAYIRKRQRLEERCSSGPNVTFSGRVGNSAGGAFLPGTYTVNFYLNGQYFAQKRFEVLADTGGSPYGMPPGGRFVVLERRRFDSAERRRRCDFLGTGAQRTHHREGQHQRARRAAEIPIWNCGCGRSRMASCTAR